MTRPAHESSNTGKVHLRDLSLDDLRDFVERYDVPAYRFKQIASWLYEKLVEEFAAMTNLPLTMRERLESAAASHHVESTGAVFAAVVLWSIK